MSAPSGDPGVDSRGKALLSKRRPQELLIGQDFVFKVSDFGVVRVHTALLATKSPKLKSFFRTHQTGVNILRLIDPLKETFSGVEQEQEIRFVLCAFITFCYCGSYDMDPADDSITVLTTIERHYLAYKYSEFFDIPGLVDFTKKKLMVNFHKFASVASESALRRELDYWWQPGWDMTRPLRVVVSECSLSVFESRMDEYKSREEYKKVVELSEAVPKLAQEYYGRLSRRSPIEVMVKLEDPSILEDGE